MPSARNWLPVEGLVACKVPANRAPGFCLFRSSRLSSFHKISVLSLYPCQPLSSDRAQRHSKLLIHNLPICSSPSVPSYDRRPKSPRICLFATRSYAHGHSTSLPPDRFVRYSQALYNRLSFPAVTAKNIFCCRPPVSSLACLRRLANPARVLLRSNWRLSCHSRSEHKAMISPGKSVRTSHPKVLHRQLRYGSAT
jgi:hypothetical protein